MSRETRLSIGVLDGDGIGPEIVPVAVGADLAELTRMFERLTTNHSERMQALGLTA